MSHANRPSADSGPRGSSQRPRTPLGWRTAAALGLALAIGHGLPAGAAPARAVGVVDFYALSPQMPVSGLIPERFVADEIAKMLPQALHGEAAVIPREAIRRAEAAVGWRAWDVLSYERLADLAREAGADQLVVGWIRRLELDSGGPGVKSPTEGGDHMLSGSATVLVQIFAAAEGRIVAEAQGDGSMLGQTRLLITRQVLHDAAGEALTKLVAKMPPAP